MLGGLVVCGVSELAVLGDLQPGWGGRDWGGQAVPRWGQRHTRVCWTQGGKLPLCIYLKTCISLNRHCHSVLSLIQSSHLLKYNIPN